MVPTDEDNNFFHLFNQKVIPNDPTCEVSIPLKLKAVFDHKSSEKAQDIARYKKVILNIEKLGK